MCNACHNHCCGSDLFSGCGCDCDEPDCQAVCDFCEQPEDQCDCHDADGDWGGKWNE
jgi:hypothetical protein